MPKTIIDYSNTIIYKITCKDPLVKDVYVGHTTNFVQRKHAHKQNCINEKSTNYKCRLYEVIRNNGGWNNWKMEIINFFNCHDHYEARKKEQEYFISLNATLNSIEPMPKPKPKEIFIKNKCANDKYYCDICNIYYDTLKLYEIHTKTAKHLKNTEAVEQLTKKNTRNSNNFHCDLCDFKCTKQSYWNRHIITAKHIRETKINDSVQNNEEKKTYVCDVCHRIYKSRVGLWKHSKTCKQSIPIINNDSSSLTLMVVELMKTNQELQKKIMDMSSINNSTVHSHNNSHNKTFNMQFFLNEQCKDAMNIMDFVDTFKLQFSDLERVGEIGYVEGISDIIIKKLNEMDIYKRPIHCSDAKRETLYVKDKNVWEKENGNHAKLRLAIKHITKKNTDMLNPWCVKHPGSCDSDNYLNDIYLEMVMQAMGGRGSMEENENKIIKKIAKTVLIDKET